MVARWRTALRGRKALTKTHLRRYPQQRLTRSALFLPVFRLRACVCVCLCVCVCRCVYTYVLYLQAYVCVCVWVCVGVGGWVGGCVYTYVLYMVHNRYNKLAFIAIDSPTVAHKPPIS